MLLYLSFSILFTVVAVILVTVAVVDLLQSNHSDSGGFRRSEGQGRKKYKGTSWMGGAPAGWMGHQLDGRGISMQKVF